MLIFTFMELPSSFPSGCAHLHTAALSESPCCMSSLTLAQAPTHRALLAAGLTMAWAQHRSSGAIVR